jgi:hypothetical protein
MEIYKTDTWMKRTALSGFGIDAGFRNSSSGKLVPNSRSSFLLWQNFKEIRVGQILNKIVFL